MKIGKRIQRALARRFLKCRELRAELARLSASVLALQRALDEYEESESYREERSADLEARHASRVRELQRQAREAEDEASYHADRIRTVTKDLERAREWGDEYGERRALDTLRRLV